MTRLLFPLLFALTGMAFAPAHAQDPSTLRLATTTSTENSGLLKALLPKFSERTGIEVQVLAVGTGQALRLGQNGDVDVVLVHAPPAEEKFVNAGYGVNRRAVMYNDFVVVGPPADPAGTTKAGDATEAFRRIAEGEHTFVSRGDDSGTHKKEKAIWKEAGVQPEGRWYREAGQGMGKVLQIAGELGAYTLTDRGTWIAYQEKVPLHIAFQGDPILYNPYGVIAVNPERFPDINYTGAMRFIAWLTSPEGQKMVADYHIAEQTLFTPMAIRNVASSDAR